MLDIFGALSPLNAFHIQGRTVEPHHTREHGVMLASQQLAHAHLIRRVDTSWNGLLRQARERRVLAATKTDREALQRRTDELRERDGWL